MLLWLCLASTGLTIREYLPVLKNWIISCENTGFEFILKIQWIRQYWIYIPTGQLNWIAYLVFQFTTISTGSLPQIAHFLHSDYLPYLCRYLSLWSLKLLLQSTHIHMHMYHKLNNYVEISTIWKKKVAHEEMYI